MFSELLWSPSKERIQNSNIYNFMQSANEAFGLSLSNYEELHAWSVQAPQEFWLHLSEFVGIKWQTKNHQQAMTLRQGDPLFKTQWFVGSTLNYAENLLEKDNPEDLALLIMQEGLSKPKRISRAALKQQVQVMVSILEQAGVQKGDRVVGVVANSEFAIVALLACSAMGAIWSSCSPDFGVTAVVDRFEQLQPKVMVFDTEYSYNGKVYELANKVSEVAVSISSIESFVSPQEVELKVQKPCHDFSQKLIELTSVAFEPLKYTPMAFDDPLYILFSSGTTGKPKCIVHGTGRALLQHQKELLLHCDLKRQEKLFYFTTCGWMMWNWMVSALSLEVAVVCWEGSPVYPDESRLWNLIDQENIQAFGTSPRYLKTLEQKNYAPQKHFSLKSLKTVLSTGAPLIPEQFSWVYKNIKEDLHLASISGGTDLVSCFMLGNPMLPVRAGELQSAGLGMSVEVWSQQGQKVSKEKGELICTKPFVSMPVSFWQDQGDEIYKKSYFHKYDGVWCHGDYLEETTNGGFIIHGRSDSTLNPSGVRIGTAELYRVVEDIESVEDSLAVSYNSGGESSILLFLKLNSSQAKGVLIEALVEKVKKTIRQQLSPRHVPQKVFVIGDIPYTRSGKKVESSVHLILSGQQPKNKEALINSECLVEYQEIAFELQKGV